MILWRCWVARTEVTKISVTLSKDEAHFRNGVDVLSQIVQTLRSIKSLSQILVFWLEIKHICTRPISRNL